MTKQDVQRRLTLARRAMTAVGVSVAAAEFDGEDGIGGVIEVVAYATWDEALDAAGETPVPADLTETVSQATKAYLRYHSATWCAGMGAHGTVIIGAAKVRLEYHRRTIDSETWTEEI